jgi:hypothetical protein
MIQRFDRDFSMAALRVALGLLVLQRSCVFVFGAHAAESFTRTGLPDALRLGLGWCEIVAAALFLVPPTAAVGGWSLVGIFLFAAALHVAHGEFDVGVLLVWTVAVLAVLAHRRPRAVPPAAPGQ